jgi:hypothetical protein
LNNLSGEEILQALKQDKRFSKMSDSETMALVPYILKIPEILGKELLSEQVSIPSLLKAKISFMKYCVDDGIGIKIAKIFLENLAKAGRNARGIAKKVNEFEPTVELVTKKVNKALNTIIGSLGKLLESKLSYPTPFKISSHIYRSLSMSDSTINRCEKENLTIADLLLIEPYIFMFNPSVK